MLAYPRFCGFYRVLDRKLVSVRYYWIVVVVYTISWDHYTYMETPKTHWEGFLIDPLSIRGRVLGNY